LQQLQAFLHARATPVLIFLLRPDAEGLTEVLLGQSGDPSLTIHPFAVEALDDQHLLAAEGRHGGESDGKPERRDDLRAEPFVLDRV